MSKPTPEQQSVINSQKNKIKVSANAGSGKTFTIMQRIASLVQSGSARLDQLLVLTFTDASAQDMRNKLKKQLGNLVSPVELQAASIGTFHSFCANVVRAWFTVAGVSPSFAVMDEIESTKLKSTIFEQVVLENYHDVSAAVNLFAVNRNLDELREVVFQIHDFLATREDCENWLKQTALTAYEPAINRNPAVQALIDYYHQLAEKYRQAFQRVGGPETQLQFINYALNAILTAKTYADFAKLEFDFPRAKSGELKDEDDFKQLRTDFRDHVCKAIKEEFNYTVTEIQADMQVDRRIVEQLIALVRAFDTAYNAKKAEYKKLDFNDLERYALKVLGNSTAMNAIRAQFKYIFVDEGQDTNPVQFKIIKLLTGDDKFFCIVGDVKQSIYGFRDCEPELFFDENKPEDKSIVLYLPQNFRSVKPILHFVNLVMEPLMQYDGGHKFIFADEPDKNATEKSVQYFQQAVSIHLAPDLEAQMAMVYHQILKAQANDQQNDIAVLSETGTHFEKLQKYLAERGIVSVIDRETDALREPEIILLNHFLFAAMNPTNELPRYLVLQYLFHFTNDELAHLRLGQIDGPLAAKVAQCDAVLSKYRQLGRTATTCEVLTQAATEFGMLEIPAVNAFLTAIRGMRDFDTVARYLYLIEHQLVKIQINVGAFAKDAVKLMTIHHSKGLEFATVILFNMGTKWSLQHNDSNKIALDKNLGICVASVDTENFVNKSPVLRLGIEKYQQARALEEKKRLLYVALTRAKNRLIIIGSWQANKFAMRPNSMLDLILTPENINFTERLEKWICHEEIVKQNQVAPVKIAKVKPTKIKLCQPVGRPDVLVKQSVTALATADEPLQDYVAPIKFADNGGKEFGTAFHRQMQYGDLPEAVQTLVAGYTVYRELPFLYMQDGSIVQGIMDLLAVKEGQAIIVDYKTTRLPKEKLIAKYREQLRLYAQAIPDLKVQAYLYSTVHNALIEVLF